MTNRFGLYVGVALASGLTLWSAQASAGGYVGASIADAAVEVDGFEETDVGDLGFDVDESDTGFKVFGGYLVGDFLGFEMAYYDFGTSEGDAVLDDGEILSPGLAQIEATAWGGFLVGNIPVGPVGIFAKVGMLSYDAEVEVRAVTDGVGVILSDDVQDEDLAYGMGMTLSFGAFGLRAEYEAVDVSDIDDVYMISVGAQLNF
jgi:OOP family OmpA-OmpF porin